MVLYNRNAIISFPRYGIGIPSLDTRKSNTVDALLAHPILGDLKDKWLVGDIPRVIDRKDLERAHTKEYIKSLYGPELESRLIQAYELMDSAGNYNRYDPSRAQQPLTELLNDVLRIISGSYLLIGHALQKGFSYYLGGGMHHAHPGFGHGFCVLNDITTALLKARAEGQIRTAWVIDLDAHRGDGTAEALADVKDILTMSIHMASGWPLDEPEYRSDGTMNPSWIPGDIDIGIPSGEEKFYIPRMMEALEWMAGKGKPDLAFVVGGVDPYEKDELPSSEPIKLTKQQMFERDTKVYEFLKERNIPQAWVAAGGYGESSWEIHTQFLEWALMKELALPDSDPS